MQQVSTQARPVVSNEVRDDDLIDEVEGLGVARSARYVVEEAEEDEEEEKEEKLLLIHHER
jgi:hypothetical protein